MHSDTGYTDFEIEKHINSESIKEMMVFKKFIEDMK